MIDLQLTIDDSASKALAAAAARGGDLTQPMKAIAVHLAAEAQLRFRAERDPLGLPWKPSQRARDESGQTLYKSGDLFRSIKAVWSAFTAAAGPEASAGAAIYAKIHQLGGRIVAQAGSALRTPFGPRASITMPQRAYLGWNDRSKARVVEILTAHIGGLAGVRG